jgi:hypothetical protein
MSPKKKTFLLLRKGYVDKKGKLLEETKHKNSQEYMDTKGDFTPMMARDIGIKTADNAQLRMSLQGRREKSVSFKIPGRNNAGIFQS